MRSRGTADKMVLSQEPYQVRQTVCELIIGSIATVRRRGLTTDLQSCLVEQLNWSASTLKSCQWPSRTE